MLLLDAFSFLQGRVQDSGAVLGASYIKDIFYINMNYVIMDGDFVVGNDGEGDGCVKRFLLGVENMPVLSVVLKDSSDGTGIRCKEMNVRERNILSSLIGDMAYVDGGNRDGAYESVLDSILSTIKAYYVLVRCGR